MFISHTCLLTKSNVSVQRNGFRFNQRGKKIYKNIYKVIEVLLCNCNIIICYMSEGMHYLLWNIENRKISICLLSSSPKNNNPKVPQMSSAVKF